MRYLDYNDTYLSKEPAHPSDNIPADLAAAELAHTTGKAMLGAVVLGYEIQCRLCDMASLRARGWDHTFYVALSAALLTGKLLGLEAAQLRHALALAATPNVPLRQSRVGELSMWKGCAAAAAARGGVFAAQLAAKGMTGPTEIFEGDCGIWHQVIAPFTFPPFGEDDDWMITHTYIKNWPVEYHAQSAVDAALQLRSQLDPAAITKIVIESFDTAIDIIGRDPEKFRPQSRETADHSLPYCVAVALIAGEVTAEQFSSTWLHDPRVVRLLERTSVVHNAALSAGYPDGIPNRLRLTLQDGSEHVLEVRYPRGHAKNPMSDREVEEKFRRVTIGTPLERVQDHVLSACWEVDEALSVGKLLRVLEHTSFGDWGGRYEPD